MAKHRPTVIYFTSAWSQVVLCLNSVVSCGLMDASILKIAKTFVSEQEEAAFMSACKDFETEYVELNSCTLFFLKTCPLIA